MRPSRPRYGLGYLEQAKRLIPKSRFGPIPDDCKKPAVMEMHKFFTLMNGCPKSKISSKWMKAMLNWYLFTHAKVEQFGISYTIKEKVIYPRNGKPTWKKQAPEYLSMSGKEKFSLNMY